jgi:hypothetical protein
MSYCPPGLPVEHHGNTGGHTVTKGHCVTPVTLVVSAHLYTGVLVSVMWIEPSATLRELYVPGSRYVP